MNKKGFTLVELLAVIAILAILVIIAMPNVLEMFNKAKQDAFETEVQSHVKAVTNEFIITGQLFYSNKVDGAAKLQMDGEDLDYYIELDTKGNIIVLRVTNGEYKIETTGTASNPIRADQIGDTVTTEVAASGEEFTMDTTGAILGNSSGNNNNPQTPQYVLKGKWKLKETLTFPQDINMKEYVNFTSNGVNYIFMEVFFVHKTLPSGTVTVDSESSIRYAEREYVQASYYGYNVADMTNKGSGGGSYLTYMTWFNYTNDSLVDFGLNNQEVSKEFYEWFTLNATQQ